MQQTPGPSIQPKDCKRFLQYIEKYWKKIYNYETDLSDFYKEVKNNKKHEQYLLNAEKRQQKIDDLMWNFKKGFFFDYDYKHRKQSNFYSLAGYYPLWAKLATHTQAKKMLDNLKHFEYDGGLANAQFNVVKCTVGDSERYPTQPGFAWTNAIFIRLIDKFSKK